MVELYINSLAWSFIKHRDNFSFTCTSVLEARGLQVAASCGGTNPSCCSTDNSPCSSRMHCQSYDDTAKISTSLALRRTSLSVIQFGWPVFYCKPFLAYFPYFEKNRIGLWGHVAVCVCVCIPPIFARQRLGRNVTAVTNTHSTVE
jgi:hypothetical protein